MLTLTRRLGLFRHGYSYGRAYEADGVISDGPTSLDPVKWLDIGRQRGVSID